MENSTSIHYFWKTSLWKTSLWKITRISLMDNGTYQAFEQNLLTLSDVEDIFRWFIDQPSSLNNSFVLPHSLVLPPTTHYSYQFKAWCVTAIALISNTIYLGLMTALLSILCSSILWSAWRHMYRRTPSIDIPWDSSQLSKLDAGYFATAFMAAYTFIMLWVTDFSNFCKLVLYFSIPGYTKGRAHAVFDPTAYELECTYPDDLKNASKTTLSLSQGPSDFNSELRYWRVQHSDESTSSKTESGSASSLASSAFSVSQHSSPHKRRRISRVDDGLDNNGDEGSENEKHPKYGQFPGLAKKTDAKRFACPFYQRNPGLHQKGSCTGPGWDFVRLNHLRVVHKRPRQCQRCWTPLKSEVHAIKHNKAGCSSMPEPEDDQLNDLQWAELWENCKWTASTPAEERWRILYRNLFPGEPVPSPYYATPSDGLETFEEFYNCKMPNLLHKAMETELQQYTDEIREKLTIQIPHLVSICSRKLFEKFRGRIPERSCSRSSQQSEASQSLGTDGFQRAQEGEISTDFNVLLDAIDPQLPFSLPSAEPSDNWDTFPDWEVE